MPTNSNGFNGGNQWDLMQEKTITEIELKGGSINNWYITNFKLKHSDDGSNWSSYDGDAILQGCKDKSTLQDVVLKPLEARYLRGSLIRYPQPKGGTRKSCEVSKD